MTTEPLYKAWKTITSKGVTRYADGPHSGKEVGSVRKKGSGTPAKDAKEANYAHKFEAAVFKTMNDSIKGNTVSVAVDGGNFPVEFFGFEDAHNSERIKKNKQVFRSLAAKDGGSRERAYAAFLDGVNRGKIKFQPSNPRFGDIEIQRDPVAETPKAAWAMDPTIQTAWAEYQKVADPALAKFDKSEREALVDYQKVSQESLRQHQANPTKYSLQYHNATVGAAWEKYKVTKQQLLDDYEKVTHPALAKYRSVLPKQVKAFPNQKSSGEAAGRAVYAAAASKPAKEIQREPVAETPKLKTVDSGLGFHVHKNPAGTFSFVGRIPTDVMDKVPATADDIMAGRSHKDEDGSLIAWKGKTFATEQEAVAHAANKGWYADTRTYSQHPETGEKITHANYAELEAYQTEQDRKSMVGKVEEFENNYQGAKEWAEMSAQETAEAQRNFDANPNGETQELLKYRKSMQAASDRGVERQRLRLEMAKEASNPNSTGFHAARVAYEKIKKN